MAKHQTETRVGWLKMNFFLTKVWTDWSRLTQIYCYPSLAWKHSLRVPAMGDIGLSANHHVGKRIMRERRKSSPRLAACFSTRFHTRAPQHLPWGGAQLEMVTGRNPSGSVVPYPHPLTLTPTYWKPIPACGFEFLPIPVPTRVFLPVG
jgi:hypothetical protein